MTDVRLLWSAEETAPRLGLKPVQLYAMVRANLVPHIRVGRRVMFSPRALEDWIGSGGSPLAGGWRRTAKASGE